MANVDIQRRLAAILAADVAGYSRLVSTDENRTLSTFRAHLKEFLEPTFARYNGRLFKTMGDGLLAEFASVVEAVQCAVAIQEGMAIRNSDAQQGNEIIFRIGINLGDVVVQDDDVFGDGVNIAARLEGLAEPGGICISRAARDQIRDRQEFELEDRGEIKVKNIRRPVRVFKVFGARKDAGDSVPISPAIQEISKSFLTISLMTVLVAGALFIWFQLSQRDARHLEPKATVGIQSGKPTIAVLPFANLSDDKEQEYFSDGLTDDLITDLSRVSGLTVIARTSTFAYKGKSQDIRTIASELGATYIVEGSVRKMGDRVRINTQLINSQTGKHIWADRFDRRTIELFDLQDEFRGKIIQALKIKLASREERWLARRPTESPQAYDLYLRGLKHESYFTRDGNLESRRLFQQATDIDPTFAIAFAHLAQSYSLAQEVGWTDQREDYATKALALAKKSVALDKELPQAHWAVGRIYARAPFRDVERSLAAVERAVALDPNYADGHALHASTLNFAGRPEEALSAMKKAMQINPHYPFWYIFNLGQTQFHLKRFDLAAESLKRAIERNQAVPWPHRWLIATYGQLGLHDEAEWEIQELQNLGQLVTIKDIRYVTTLKNPDYLKQFIDGLRKAGVPEE